MVFLDDLTVFQQFVAYMAGAALAVSAVLIVQMIRRWRRGIPVRQPGDGLWLAETGLNAMSFAGFLALINVWSDMSTAQCAVALAAIGILLIVSGECAKLRWKAQQEKAIVNPKLTIGAVPPPVPVDWSNEARLAAIWVPALVVYIGMVFALIWGGKAAGFSQQSYAGMALLWMLGVPLLIAFGRSPMRIRQRHTLVIKAPPQQVWDTLHCRETDAYYRAPTARIEKVPGTANMFVWHYGDVGPCCQCGLPRGKHSGQELTPLLVEVVEQETGRRARQIATYPASAPFSARLYRREENGFEIVSHADGAEITYSIDVVGARLWMFALTLSGNIPKDLLDDLKAHLEGTKSHGVFGAGRNHLEFAAASPLLCGCS